MSVDSMKSMFWNNKKLSLVVAWSPSVSITRFKAQSFIGHLVWFFYSDLPVSLPCLALSLGGERNRKQKFVFRLYRISGMKKAGKRWIGLVDIMTCPMSIDKVHKQAGSAIRPSLSGFSFCGHSYLPPSTIPHRETMSFGSLQFSTFFCISFKL